MFRVYRVILEVVKLWAGTQYFQVRERVPKLMPVCLILVLSMGLGLTLCAEIFALDSSFGTGGIVTTAIGSGNDIGRSVAIQSDGTIVVAGYTSNGTNYDIAVARYTTNGALDTTFGTGGIVTTAIGSGDDYGRAVAIQSDGKIVVAGYTSNGTNHDIVVVRYTANGTLDTTFGTGGIVTTAIGSGDEGGFAVVLQSDGKIVVAGHTSNGTDFDAMAVRYMTNGTLDTTFGTGGIVTTAIGSGNDYGFAVVLQSDGKIVVAGHTSNGTDFDVMAVRYMTNGTLDTTFGTGGIVTTAIGSGDDYGFAGVLQSDGKFIVAGYTSNGTNYDFAMARYTTNGTLDTTFGTSGKVTTAIGSGNDYGRAVVLQSDGMIVVVGDTWNGTIYPIAVVRYNTDGSLDTTFGSGGIVTTAIGEDDWGNAVALQSDWKIVVTGQTWNGTDYDFAVVRYLAAEISFMEDFESGTFPPAGWNLYQTGSGGNWQERTDEAYSPTHSAAVFMRTTDSSAWLVLPQVTLATGSPKLRFKTFEDHAPGWNIASRRVCISTGSGDPNDGDYIGCFDVGGMPEGSWYGSTVVLNQFAGQTVYLAFRCTGDAFTTDDWYIDDVNVDIGAPEINIKQQTTIILNGTGNYNFGSVNVGSNLATTFTIENIGTADLTLPGNPVQIYGDNPGDFSVTQQPTSPVAQSDSKTFTLQFAPTSDGAKTATISIANNDSNENPYTFTVNGTGQALNNFLLWTK